MLTSGAKVFLKCKLSRSTFDAERIFAVSTSSGEPYTGIAPLGYCYKNDGTRLPASQPGKNNEVAGKLAARLIKNGSNVAYVAVPGGETIDVRATVVSPRS